MSTACFELHKDELVILLPIGCTEFAKIQEFLGRLRPETKAWVFDGLNKDQTRMVFVPKPKDED